ncbi:MAG: helix-turn-helix transcriptional regulator [Candidatus Limnocylindrales bacterium]
MGSRERPVDVGAAVARTIRGRLASEMRSARLQSGLTQVAVATAVGISRSQYSRIERGLSPDVSIDMAARVLAVLGLTLAVQTYPAGDPLRDVAHSALLERLHDRCHRSFRWRTEVPLPIPGDLRAWDATASTPDVRIGVEGETRLHDAQAVDRKIALKERDGAMDRVILLVADTRHNRQSVRAYGDLFQARFPISGSRALELLAAGVDPGGNALILL